MANVLYGVNPKVRREGLGGGASSDGVSSETTDQLETVSNGLINRVGFPNSISFQPPPPTAAQMNAGTPLPNVMSRQFAGESPDWMEWTGKVRKVITQQSGSGGAATTVMLDGVTLDATGVAVNIYGETETFIQGTGTGWVSGDTIEVQYEAMVAGMPVWETLFTVPVTA
jgi:hypothetical protein